MNKEEQFKSEMNKAGARVYEMDKIDGYKPRDLCTILQALESGLQINPKAESAVWDAFIMLSEHVATLKGFPTGATLLVSNRRKEFSNQ